ncbi:MAG TPA: sugar transferase [Urbifossiella sp.]|nr:sugar transferase [Urbifossiella sp.]
MRLPTDQAAALPRAGRDPLAAIVTGPGLPPAARLRVRDKAAVDFVLALVLVVAAAPFILAAAALTRLTSRGPAFYSQTRVGLNGRVFRIYKIRTMRHNCEAASGAKWATARDPRVTAVGRVLRKTHLDELPQLWNVLKGDMSLVGPRPERPEFVARLARDVDGYLDRLTVRPGVTGLAQVQLAADTDLESVRRKLRYDLHYIGTAGPWLDLRLMLSTAFKMLHLPFGVSRVVLRIPGEQVVERDLILQDPPVARQTAVA